MSFELEKASIHADVQTIIDADLPLQIHQAGIKLGQAATSALKAIERSGFEIGPCRVCGKMVVHIPEGLPMCDSHDEGTE